MRLSCLCLMLTVGCGGGSDLNVDLRTDYLPGVEFSDVRATLSVDDSSSAFISERAVTADEDFATGRRIGTLTDLPSGVHTLVVDLLDPGRAVVASRTLRVTVRADAAITAVITRACEGVVCPGTGDPPDATTCEAGRCVPPECTPENPEACPTECAADGGCDGGVAAVDAGGPVDSGVPDAGAPTVAATDYCAIYAERYCAAVPTCCSMADTIPPACYGELLDGCQAGLAEIFADDRVLFDPARAAASLAEAEALLASCAAAPLLEWGGSRQGFLDAFVGTLADGVSCEPIGASPDEAHVAVVVCDSPDASCRGAAGSRTCQARGAPGASCTYAGECQEGFRCVRPGTTTLAPGTCATTGEVTGSHCRLDDECVSLSCTAANFLTPGVCEDATADAVYCPDLPPPPM